MIMNCNLPLFVDFEEKVCNDLHVKCSQILKSENYTNAIEYFHEIFC